MSQKLPKGATAKRKAAVFDPATRGFHIQEYPVNTPEAGQVGLSLLFSGICGTDIHICEGKLGPMPFPLVLGHEFIGRVEALGSGVATDGLGTPLAVGDSVIACVAIPCGRCLSCQKGETASCMAFGVTYMKPVADPPHFHGGFAEYQEIASGNLIRVPPELNLKAVAAFPCGGPTIIRSCVYGGGLEPGELVVVQGNGSLGLFAMAYAKAQGCRVICVGSTANPARLEATKALEPARFFDFRMTSDEAFQNFVVEEAKRLKRGDGADVVIETSGDPAAFKLGISLLRTRGRYVVPGQYSNRGEVPIPPHIITFRALRIIGSGQHTMGDICGYLDFLAAHPELQKIFAAMVSTYRVADVEQAIAAASSGRAIKAAFTLTA